MAPNGNGHTTKAQLQEALTGERETNAFILERLAELELQLEDVGWRRLAFDGDQDFSRDAVREIGRTARLYYLKNPTIQRGVNVQRDYVWGQGVTIQAADPDVDDVIQEFLADAKNQVELTGHQAQLGKEVELALAGNLFFVFFPNPNTGRVRVRTLPADEIDDVIANPEDAKEPWYYKRVWNRSTVNIQTGQPLTESQTTYYPDWRYQPASKPTTIGEARVEWNSPVYHVKTGGLPSMRFGVPEVYAALDWARAYKSFLEDWATIVRAYSRFAWQLTTKGGKTGIAAAKAKLGTTLSTTGGETNPAPLTGSTFIGGEGTNMNPVRTAGATTSADDGRRLLLMVAATFGFPETFWGDADVGTLATAESLDRPSELKVISRQSLWRDVFAAILEFVIAWAVRAGRLPGTVESEDDGTPRVELEVDPETGEPRSQSVEIAFPPILEHDVTQTVTAIVQAATLGGGTPAGLVDAPTISRMLLSALGVDDVEAALDALYDDDGNLINPPPAPAASLPPAPVGATAQEAALFESVRRIAGWLARERVAA